MPTVFKLAILGDCGVGKTTFIERHTTGKFIKNYTPSDVKVSALQFNFTSHVIVFNVWDVAGNTNILDYKEQSSDFDGAIIMFDVTNPHSYSNLAMWYDTILKIKNIPVVIVGNKCDIADRKVKAKSITFHREKSLFYFDISSKSNYNFDKPFLYLSRKLTGDSNLRLVESEALLFSDIRNDKGLKDYLKELTDAASDIQQPKVDEITEENE